MTEPSWLKTISNHAVITKAELLEWLGVTGAQLGIMMRDAGFPPPRFGRFYSKSAAKRITNTCRWRVGDVRAWLEGSARLQKELETEIGAERANTTKALIALGINPMGGWNKRSD